MEIDEKLNNLIKTIEQTQIVLKSHPTNESILISIESDLKNLNEIVSNFQIKGYYNTTNKSQEDIKTRSDIRNLQRKIFSNLQKIHTIQNQNKDKDNLMNNELSQRILDLKNKFSDLTEQTNNVNIEDKRKFLEQIKLFSVESTNIFYEYKSISPSQRKMLSDIQENDHEIDQNLQNINEGVLKLKSLAIAQNEEVKLQHTMLDNVSLEMDYAHDRVTKVKNHLQGIIKKSRKAEKVFIDILCMLLTIALLMILYKLNQNSSS